MIEEQSAPRIRLKRIWRGLLVSTISQSRVRSYFPRAFSQGKIFKGEGIRKYILMFLFFFAVSVFLSRGVLDTPFRGDDFHLIRAYSLSELGGVWTGPWDPDGIETPGFRPLTTVFNHLRASLFGESVIGHRLLLLSMFSAYLTLAFALVNRTLGISYQQALLGGIFVVLHTASLYHYFWISDGVHLLAGTLVVGSILLLVKYIESGNFGWLLASLILAFLGLLTREESLLVLALAAMFAAALLTRNRLYVRRHVYLLRLILYSVSMVVVVAMYWYWRGTAVPNAVPLRFDATGLLWSIMQTVQNLGDSTHLVVWWGKYILVIWLWTIVLGILAAGFLFLLPKSDQARGAWLAGAVVIGAISGLTYARTNLLLLSVTFWGFLLALTLIGLSKLSTLSLYLAVAISVFLMWASWYGSTTIAQAVAPGSIDRIQSNTIWLYGEHAGATIPEARRDLIAEELSTYGIHSLNDFNVAISELIEDAKSHHRYDPNSEGLAYIPRFRFNLGVNWRAWSYVGRDGWILD